MFASRWPRVGQVRANLTGFGPQLRQTWPGLDRNHCDTMLAGVSHRAVLYATWCGGTQVQLHGAFSATGRAVTRVVKGGFARRGPSYGRLFRRPPPSIDFDFVHDVPRAWAVVFLGGSDVISEDDIELPANLGDGQHTTNEESSEYVEESRDPGALLRGRRRLLLMCAGLARVAGATPADALRWIAHMRMEALIRVSQDRLLKRVILNGPELLAEEDAAVPILNGLHFRASERRWLELPWGTILAGILALEL